MEKKKKRLIILSIIAGAMVLLLLLTSTVFSIREVTIEHQTTLNVLTKTDLDNMINKDNMPYRKSIFFTSMKPYIKEIEEAYPYAKVNGIVRKFPNQLVVKISERVPVVRVATSGGEYILDSDLKVLNIAKVPGDYNSISGEKDLPELIIAESFGFNLTAYKKSGFVDNEVICGYVDAIYRGVVHSDKTNPTLAISDLKMIQSIEVSYVKELERVRFKIVYTDSGLTSEIIGDNNLKENIYKVFSATQELDSSEYSAVNCTDGVVYAVKK